MAWVIAVTETFTCAWCDDEYADRGARIRCCSDLVPVPSDQTKLQNWGTDAFRRASELGEVGDG